MRTSAAVEFTFEMIRSMFFGKDDAVERSWITTGREKTKQGASVCPPVKRGRIQVDRILKKETKEREGRVEVQVFRLQERRKGTSKQVGDHERQVGFGREAATTTVFFFRKEEGAKRPFPKSGKN